MAKVISIFNQKGGIGKTTTTYNLGYGLLKLGYKVLLIDLDPQSSLTKYFNVRVGNRTIYDILLNGEPVRTCKIDIKGITLIPSCVDLAAAEIELSSKPNKTQCLRNVLEPLKNDYDYILIDCPPSLGLLSVNALTASDKVIVPMTPEYLAFESWDLAYDTIKKIQAMNKGLSFGGILITMYDGRPLHYKEVANEIFRTLPHFKTKIKRSVKFSDSVVANMPIHEYDKKFKDYLNLAKEVEGWRSE